MRTQAVVTAGATHRTLEANPAPELPVSIPSLKGLFRTVPHDLRVERLSELPEEIRVALGRATRIATDNAHALYTGCHIGASLVIGKETVEGCNVDTSNRGKNCAEKNALHGALAKYPDLREVDAIVVVIGRGTDEGLVRSTDPICLCGDCRTLFSNFASSQTLIYMATVNTREVHVSSFDRILPLQARQSGQAQMIDPRTLSGISSLRVLETALLPSPLNDVLGAAQEKFTACEAQITGVKIGAAVLTSNKIYPASKLERVAGGATPLVETAEMLALKSAIVAGDKDIQALVMVGSWTPPFGVPAPDGTARQLLFDIAQLVQRDIPVVLAASGSSTVVKINISDLFPLGDGPRDSTRARPLAFYTPLPSFAAIDLDGGDLNGW